MKLIQIERPPQRKRKDGKPAPPPASKAFVKETKNQVSLNYVKRIPGDKDDEIQKRSIKIYTVDKLMSQVLQKQNIWTFYKFDQETWNLFVKKDRTRYENLVCGYLQYYDLEVRNGMSDHGIYFHWGSWDNDPYCCVIFMDPRPKTKKPDYRDTSKTDRFGRKYFGEIEEIDPPVSKISDPPKPPPPPPPY